MKKEKQTGIVLAASPYRDLIKPEERKLLSKEQAKDLVKIVNDGSYLISDNKYDTITALDELEAIKKLELLGYANHDRKIYAKGPTFYRIRNCSMMGIGPYTISIVSGTFYGNLDELLEDFKKFDDLSNSARKKFGFFETWSIFPALGLPIYQKSRELQKLAMKLPQEFASYKYGKDAIEQLRKEYADKQPKDTANVPLHKKRGKKGLNPIDIPKYSNIIENLFLKKYTK